MNKLIKSIAYLVFFTTVGEYLNAQSGTYYTIRDFETWNSIELKYKLNKKLKLGVQQQLRLNNNSSLWNQNFTELMGTYKISKSFNLGAEYRYLRRNDTEGNIQGTKRYHRYALNLTYSKKIKRFNLSTRIQYQNRKQFGDLAPINNDPLQKVRWKLAGKYNIKNWKLDPEISAEIFQPLFNESELEKYRITAGTKYDLKKNWGTFKVFYRFEKDLNVQYPLAAHILGINYTYTIKRKK